MQLMQQYRSSRTSDELKVRLPTFATQEIDSFKGTVASITESDLQALLLHDRSTISNDEGNESALEEPSLVSDEASMYLEQPSACDDELYEVIRDSSEDEAEFPETDEAKASIKAYQVSTDEIGVAS